jgi:hypothetical protein
MNSETFWKSMALQLRKASLENPNMAPAEALHNIATAIDLALIDRDKYWLEAEKKGEKKPKGLG